MFDLGLTLLPIDVSNTHINWCQKMAIENKFHEKTFKGTDDGDLQSLTRRSFFK